MKTTTYISLVSLVLALGSCSSSRSLSSTMEDDIYYVPGQKSLIVKEVENQTGQEIPVTTAEEIYRPGEAVSTSAGSSTPPSSFSPTRSRVINTQTGKLDEVSSAELAAEAQQRLASENEVNETIYENTGYWIGGYKGNESDLPEIQRIINQYPEGFGFIANSQDIAMNLAFDQDWNVYTDNGRYWWFPSSSNINLYTTLLFGTYPKYIWTVIWDNPRFDSWAFNNTFNSGFNLGFNLGWNSPGWSFGIGWNSGWYRPWGGWYDPFYNPWWGSSWYPGWYYPHWHYPHWHPGHGGWYPPHGGGHFPNRPPSNPLRPGGPIRPGFTRPGVGNSISGIRPGGTRPGTGNVRPGTATRPSGTVRPGTGSSIRPGTGTTVRPGNTTTRPSGLRPGGTTTIRPSGTLNSTTTRPGSTTRPNTNIRPGATTRPATRPNTSVRPATRPNTTARPNTMTRPASGTGSSYTRPTTRTSGGNVKSYSRPQSSYRPTYNNNNTSRYNSTTRSNYSGNSGSSRSSYSGSSRNSGGSTTPVRSSGGHRR